MKKILLQSYKDGAIYKNSDGTYTIEAQGQTVSGDTIYQALAILQVEEPKEVKKKKSKKPIDE